MTSSATESAKLRDKILNLLTDEETARVSTREDGRAMHGEFIDLEDLGRGVQNGGFAGTVGRALPKDAVSTATWNNIVALLKA